MQKAQYVNQVKLGTAMGIMTNRNARSGQLAFLLLAFACLAMFQPGCSKVQDIDQLRQAAEQGDAEAQNKLGVMYLRGEGVPENNQEAVKWFRKAAEQGHAPAQNKLGFMYSRGEGVPENNQEAVKWYRKAAEQGLDAAQFNLGFMYWTGDGVPKDDREAAKWYRKAAEQGYATAQWGLGGLYSKGDGVPEDHREAAKWYRKAAEQGLDAAQYSLGDSYYKGEGVAKDDREAAKWYQKAAEQGHVTTQFNMGVMYYKGEGVPKDYVKAYAWWNLASAQGHKTAGANRGQLEAILTAEEFAEAQELAAELSKSNKKQKPQKERKGEARTTVERAAASPAPKQDKIVCNKFTLNARIKGNDLLLAVDTDLPDYAKVAVSVGRIYYEVGNKEAYSHPYFSKTEPVGSWRKPRRIALDAAAWKTSLVEHQRKMNRVGGGLEFGIGKIDKHIEVSAFLNAIENDPRLGGIGNPKVVRNVNPHAEKKLLFPLLGSYSSLRSKFGAWDNLKVGVKYRLSKITTVVSAIPGTPEARRNFLSTKLSAGEVIQISQVIHNKNDLFYRAALAEDPSLEFFINSVVLIQQNLQVVQ